MIRSFFVRSFVLCLGVAGCNAILDNKPASIDDGASPTDVNPSDPNPTGSSSSSSSTDSDSGTASDKPVEPGSCGTSAKMCGGSCRSTDDPIYGCGSGTCSSCPAQHDTPRCDAAKCAILACDPGYADCNGNVSDGCETDLSKATSCGACNAVCPPATPVCVPAGNGFQCSTGCTPAAPLLCGTECVSPLTSANHCGGCNQKCPDVTNGTVGCTAGQCQFTCKTGFHACGATCQVTTDPKACGPTCIVCPTPANATPTCAADTCGFQCNPGFGNCNANNADGCETNFATDSLNCGACGATCAAGLTCQAGACKPATDAGG